MLTLTLLALLALLVLGTLVWISQWHSGAIADCPTCEAKGVAWPRKTQTGGQD